MASCVLLHFPRTTIQWDSGNIWNLTDYCTFSSVLQFNDDSALLIPLVTSSVMGTMVYCEISEGLLNSKKLEELKHKK